MTNNSAASVSISLIAKAFTSQYYPALFGGSESHDAARDLIAQLVHHTQDEDLLREIVRSGLPADYSGDTLDEVADMVRGALKKGFDQGGEVDPNKSIASQLLELVEDQIIDLFHDDQGRPYMTVAKGENGQQNLSIRSKATARWLSSKWYRATRLALQDGPIEAVAATLAARACFEGEQREIAIRVARSRDAMYFDLCDHEASMVEIDGRGWRIVNTASVKFIRPVSAKALPLPTRGGALLDLKTTLKISDRNWPLICAFILAAIKPKGPYFCLLVDGEQGSGKSFLCSAIKSIVDPSQIEKLPLPGSDAELFIAAKDTHVLVFDNASFVRRDISDALCRLSTGGSTAKRVLYTDDDVHVMTHCSPFIINGIGDFAERPDLLERAILLSLEAFNETERRSESGILAEIDGILPGFLGALFDVLSCAIKNESLVESPTSLRMADAARWLAAAEPATGFTVGTLLKSIEESQNFSVIDRIRNQTLFRVLEKLVSRGQFEGQFAELFDRLILENDNLDRSFPKTAAHLSNELRRHRQAMLKAGLIVEFMPRSRTGRRVRISLAGDAKKPPTPPPKRPAY